ncbi:MAG: hypothetical protein ACREA9_19595, partial [Pyrinomonadaceae bacterium]
MDKQAELLALAKKRQTTRYPSFNCIGDYHGGVYECDLVSPYTKTAGNINAEIMVMLQDWASDDFLRNHPFHEPSAKFGHDPTRPTNRKLKTLLNKTFGLGLAEIYSTNLFPFVKLGDMSAKIPMKYLVSAAREFAMPQLRIVNPRLVICLGLDTFNALRQANGFSRTDSLDFGIQNPFNIGMTRVWCQAHTGRLSNRGSFERVLDDWRRMKSDIYGSRIFRQDDQRHRVRATHSSTGEKITTLVSSTRPLSVGEKKMNTKRTERKYGGASAREPILCFNNAGTGGKDHAYLYGKNAFFDLWANGRQANLARNLHT